MTTEDDKLERLPITYQEFLDILRRLGMMNGTTIIDCDSSKIERAAQIERENKQYIKAFEIETAKDYFECIIRLVFEVIRATKEHCTKEGGDTMTAAKKNETLTELNKIANEIIEHLDEYEADENADEATGRLQAVEAAIMAVKNA